MNRRDSIRIPARLLLWLGGVVCGLALQNRAPWALTVAFLGTLCALLALSYCDQMSLDATNSDEIPLRSR
jgi:hypothetical protein